MPRLTRIYTRKGDRGETALGAGGRLSKDAPRVALAFSLQIQPSLPVEPHDEPVDWIVTEGESIACRAIREESGREAIS